MKRSRASPKTKTTQSMAPPWTHRTWVLKMITDPRAPVMPRRLPRRITGQKEKRLQLRVLTRKRRKFADTTPEDTAPKKKDCRFDHPTVCQKFHNHGSLSSDPKGCNGKCNAFHPNACRSSLKNKTCSWDECRFYHLKGTKRTSRDSNQNTSQTAKRNTHQNPNSYQNRNQHGPNNTGPNNNQNRKPNSNNAGGQGHNQQNNNRNQNRNQPAPNAGQKSNSVFQQDQPGLNSTLQEIIKRLTAMETAQAMMNQLVAPTHQIRPLLSPAVPQPGTQTQYRWASPVPWTQTQM